MSNLQHLAAAVLLCAVSAAAHDLWIEPSSFVTRADDIVSVRLRVGQDLLGDPLPRSSALIREFVVANSAGRTPLLGREGSDPAGFLQIAAPGVHVIGYYSHPSRVEMAAEKFDAYLKEEGLGGILALRSRLAKQSGNGAGKVSEIFSRCAKALVLSAPAAKGAPGDRALGFPLELVAERNPYAMRMGDSLPVRLTYQNRPLVNTLVVALNRTDPSQRQMGRTDREGRVHFRLGAGGMWMIKAVHMVAAPPGSQAQWASYWASLTFAMGDTRNAR